MRVFLVCHRNDYGKDEAMNREYLMGPGASVMCIVAMLVFAVCSGVVAQNAGSTRATPDEQRSLDEIYQAALAEGGSLVVYAGGDVPDGNAGIEKAFKARFPGIDIRVITDLSKYHDTRIDQ